MNMNTEQILDLAEGVAKQWDWATEVSRPRPDSLDVKVKELKELVPIIVGLRVQRLGYLSAIVGMDLGPEANELEVLYHFCPEAAVITLRVRIPRQNAVLPSLCDIIPSAEVFERELREMFGVELTGLHNAQHLYLPDEWPADVYPLRKDFDPAVLANVPLYSEPQKTGLSSNGFTVPIGPQHPALKEPGNFQFTVEGEIVTGAYVRLGYAHRGMEKAAEERNWVQNLYLLERVCGICSHIHAFAYALAVEQLANVQVPPRAQAIRVLVAELERIHSHFLWVGVSAHEAGFDTLFMYSWRDREKVMDMLEGLTGNRVNYSANLLGGVKFDITPEQETSIREGLNFLEERARHYLNVLKNDEMFLQRTRGIGQMTRAQAEVMGAVGPTARASNVRRDLRVTAPYSAYPDFPVKMILDTRGDLEARFEVRIQELFESFRLIRQILDCLPEGELSVKIPRRIPAGEAVVRLEAPRGEVLYYVKSNGTDKPERVKVRTPTICNFNSVVHLVVGHQLADVPMILAGIDPCFSCNDRMIQVNDSGNGSERMLTWANLRQYGIDYYKRSSK